MDFELSEENRQLKALTREIVERECMPLEPQYLREDLHEFLHPEHRKHLVAVSKNAGIWNAHIPREFGGGGVGLLGNVLIREEAWRCVVLLPQAEVSVILFECNDRQREDYLFPVINGEKRTAFAQTESQSGSDPGGMMETRAERSGDDWVINGRKFFISRSMACDFWQVQAVTDPEKRQRGGITMFLVDRGTPGITVTEIKTWHDYAEERAPCEVVFENVRVPQSQVLGEVGNGFRLGQRWLTEHDRLLRGATALGQMDRAFEMSLQWARHRWSFGKPIAARQAIQWMIVDMYTDIQALRALMYQAAWKVDHGDTKEARYLGSHIKLISAEWGFRTIDKAMQIHGGIGETNELPITRFYRNLRHSRIGGGTDEMHRMVLARWLLGKDVTNV